ncbi:MAG: glutaredoxin domain-containing protein [candidate division WOR-3 bacterium]
MTFQIFAREGCEICNKAKEVLSRLGVEVKVRYVDGPNATVENLADFAWFGWTDTPPLVVVTEEDRVIKRWDGAEISDTNRSWHLEVKRWVESQIQIRRS